VLRWVVDASPLVHDFLVVRRPQSDVLAAHVLWEWVDRAAFHATVLTSANAFFW